MVGKHHSDPWRAGLLFIFLPYYVLVDSSRGEIRLRRGLYRLLPRPRVIPFADVEDIILWARFVYALQLTEVWIEVRGTSAIKLVVTKDHGYADHLANSLAERTGAKVVLKEVSGAEI